jgi:hypothetical protein
MDAFMKEHQSIGTNDLADMRRDFTDSLEVCSQLWGGAAFKRSEHGQWRDLALAGMYDAEMVAVYTVGSDKFAGRRGLRSRVLSETRRLFEKNATFSESVRTGTNTPSRLRARVEIMVATLEELV